MRTAEICDFGVFTALYPVLKILSSDKILLILRLFESLPEELRFTLAKRLPSLLFGVIALVYVRLKGEDKFSETIYFLVGQSGCFSMLITDVVFSQHLLDGLGTTVIQIGRGPPRLN
jgi:hypothetical protein